MNAHRSIFALLFFLSACAGPGRSAVISRFTGNPPRSIAIVPFESITQRRQPGEMTASLFNEALAKRFAMADPQKLHGALVREKGSFALDRSGARKIGKAVGVDAVLYGSAYVLEGDPSQQYFPEREPEIGVSARLVDVKTGSVIWSGNLNGVKPISVFAYRRTVDEAVSEILQSMVNELASSLILSAPPLASAQSAAPGVSPASNAPAAPGASPATATPVNPGASSSAPVQPPSPRPASPDAPAPAAEPDSAGTATAETVAPSEAPALPSAAAETTPTAQPAAPTAAEASQPSNPTPPAEVKPPAAEAPSAAPAAPKSRPSKAKSKKKRKG